MVSKQPGNLHRPYSMIGWAWQCGNVTNWQCDNVTMWKCDNVTMWQCDNVTVWQCDNVTMWQCDNVTITMWQCELDPLDDTSSTSIPLSAASPIWRHIGLGSTAAEDHHCGRWTPLSPLSYVGNHLIVIGVAQLHSFQEVGNVSFSWIWKCVFFNMTENLPKNAWDNFRKQWEVSFWLSHMITYDFLCIWFPLTRLFQSAHSKMKKNYVNS